MTILVTGANGQLGNEICRSSTEYARYMDDWFYLPPAYVIMRGCGGQPWKNPGVPSFALNKTFW